MYKLLLISVLAFAVVGVGASVHRQPFVPLHRATALCGCLYASLHNDFVRPLSCILCTFMNALLVSHPCETLGVHFIRHPCLTRKLRVLPPAAPKIIPRLLSGRKCSGVSNCGRLGRCIVQRLCATAIVHPLHVYERSVGFASLRNFGRSFYKASVPYPQVACSPSPSTKNNTPLVERGIIFGADGGGRTRTVLLPTDFESVTSANSITSAY